MIVGLTALLVPPVVNEGTNLADNAPRYVEDVRDYVQKNERLNEINQDYQITDKLEEEAAKLPSQDRRRGRRPARHRLRPGERHLRLRDDHGPGGVHAERRPGLAPARTGFDAA